MGKIKDSVGSAVAARVFDIGGRSWKVKKLLGEGGFGYVYLVENAHGHQQAALKVISIPTKEQRTQAQQEIKTWKSLPDHRNIVKLIDAGIFRGPKGEEALLLMELCSGGGVLDMMNDRFHSRFSEGEILDIFSQVCAGVEVMHNREKPIAHRDLKVENILIEGGNYKLCDFGSATMETYHPQNERERNDAESDIQRNTTLDYRAPEMLDLYRKQVINEKVDIWALGVMLYKLCFFAPPFEEGSSLGILNVNYSIPDESRYSAKLHDLIKFLLVGDPADRPDIHQVLRRLASMQGKAEPHLVSKKIETAPPPSASAPTRTIRPPSPLGDAPTPVRSQSNQAKSIFDAVEWESDGSSVSHHNPNRNSGRSSPITSPPAVTSPGPSPALAARRGISRSNLHAPSPPVTFDTQGGWADFSSFGSSTAPSSNAPTSVTSPSPLSIDPFAPSTMQSQSVASPPTFDPFMGSSQTPTFNPDFLVTSPPPMASTSSIPSGTFSPTFSPQPNFQGNPAVFSPQPVLSPQPTFSGFPGNSGVLSPSGNLSHSANSPGNFNTSRTGSYPDISNMSLSENQFQPGHKKSFSESSANLQRSGNSDQFVRKLEDLSRAAQSTKQRNSTTSVYNFFQEKQLEKDGVSCVKSLAILSTFLQRSDATMLDEGFKNLKILENLRDKWNELRLTSQLSEDLGFSGLISTVLVFFIKKLQFHHQFPAFEGSYSSDTPNAIANREIATQLIELQKNCVSVITSHILPKNNTDSVKFQLLHPLVTEAQLLFTALTFVLVKASANNEMSKYVTSYQSNFSQLKDVYKHVDEGGSFGWSVQQVHSWFFP
eukprot:TRINITY_DN6807_c0_g1_i5.p1 TRINITY_DN6807_c0_g1~~TRINITY_DN6807_c0_g1_i5.p1  ORF type:complete len:854 (+),score=258.52 TRINITY_DN6807_c0_g1_i5:85-2562(+)